MKKILSTALAFGLLAAFSAEAAEWTVDKVHSKIGFAVKHLTISTVRGEFTSYDAAIHFDPQKPEQLSFEATIDVNSISTENDRRDTHLKSPDFFDAEHFPTMTFKSKTAQKIADGQFKVTGDLTIRGTTREVVLDVEGLHQVVELVGIKKTAATATATINRQDFGLTWSQAIETGGLIVDDMVKIIIEVELDMKS
ncbi:MAG: YceI family protein [bacterium]|nr:YceI family protein [bacterium]